MGNGGSYEQTVWNPGTLPVIRRLLIAVFNADELICNFFVVWK